MRTGFSTSACAAAASAAALRALISGETVTEIVIDLPARRRVPFQIRRCEFLGDGVRCGVVKDSGDDPDVTNGIEIQSIVRRSQNNTIEIRGGSGVGVVTLPGLPVAVGEAAINPGPRRLILQALRAELVRLGVDEGGGFIATICVPDGERVALETMNPKLGVVGGISILGTDGLVHPYSLPAYRMSIFYELRVAKENGCRTIGLATGKRSANYLKKALNETNDLAIVNVGDEIGFPIDRAIRLNFDGIEIGGMIGKLSKLAQGRFQTHVQEGEVDFDFLSDLARRAGAPNDACEKIRTCRTARAVQNLLQAHDICIEPLMADLAVGHVWNRCGGKINAGVWLFGLNGELLAVATKGAGNESE